MLFHALVGTRRRSATKCGGGGFGDVWCGVPATTPANPPPEPQAFSAALHLRSHYSLLRAVWGVEDMVAGLVASGYQAGALADWNSIAGAVAFWKEMRRRGLHPVLGCELEMRHGSMPGSIVVLVESNAGYHSLCRILTRQSQSGLPALPDLGGRVEGLVALTSGKDGMLHRLLVAGQGAEAVRWVRAMRRVFGAEATYLQVLNQHPGDAARLATLLAIAEDEGMPPVAAMEARYAAPGDGHLLQALASIGTLTLLDEDAESKPHPASGYHLRLAQEWRDAYAHVPGAVERAVELARKCRLPLFDEMIEGS